MWFFDTKSDTRSELERKFYVKSDWEPPKACVEIESFINRIQEKFDSWRPKRWIKDNLTREERLVLNNIRQDQNTIYMWEDKGPSFTKMSKSQYYEAGENELSQSQFYEVCTKNNTKLLQGQCNNLVNQLVQKGEISEKLGGYLKTSDAKSPNFYHVLKTHNLPLDDKNISNWLTQNGYPVRGIISGISGPFEKLSGLIDHVLQPGMKRLPSYLKDTKHTLQVIENINQQIDKGEMSLEGVYLNNFGC